MQNYDTLEIETSADQVATVWLNRPEKHNAMSAQMIADLTNVAAEIAESDIRVVVLAGKGRSFCAGGDLKWMQAQINATAEVKIAEAKTLAMMLMAWNTLPQPVIGRVHGNAFGGGVGLASICDVAIGVHGTTMGLTETKLGLTPATIGPYVVARMGAAMARRVFMSSRRFDSEEAVTLGLLARVVTPEALDQAVIEEAEPYLSCAPGAVAEAKALVGALGPRIDTDTIDMTIAGLVQRWESPEAIAGLAAFFDKTTPPWVKGAGPAG